MLQFNLRKTIQSVRFAEKSQTPVMFLITKIDKRDANIEQVEGSIAAHFESSEIYPISAKTGKGVDEMLMFLHEKMSERNLVAPSSGFGEGHVLEVDAKNRGHGISATVLCTRGEFKPGNMVLTGSNACKIRAIFDENKNKMKSAKPGEFFQMTGFKSVPEPGSYIQDRVNFYYEGVFHDIDKMICTA